MTRILDCAKGWSLVAGLIILLLPPANALAAESCYPYDCCGVCVAPCPPDATCGFDRSFTCNGHVQSLSAEERAEICSQVREAGGGKVCAALADACMSCDQEAIDELQAFVDRQRFLMDNFDAQWREMEPHVERAGRECDQILWDFTNGIFKRLAGAGLKGLVGEKTGGAISVGVDTYTAENWQDGIKTALGAVKELAGNLKEGAVKRAFVLADLAELGVDIADSNARMLVKTREYARLSDSARSRLTRHGDALEAWVDAKIRLMALKEDCERLSNTQARVQPWRGWRFIKVAASQAPAAEAAQIRARLQRLNDIWRGIGDDAARAAADLETASARLDQANGMIDPASEPRIEELQAYSTTLADGLDLTVTGVEALFAAHQELRRLQD